MSSEAPVVVDKKQILMDQINKLQSKIDAIEKQRADKINKLAKKFKLLDLDDQTIEKEFSLIKEKYSSVIEKKPHTEAIKKN